LALDLRMGRSSMETPWTLCLAKHGVAVNDQNHVKSTASTQCHHCDGQCCYYTRILNNTRELVVISYLAFVLF
jgi:hypothetical protein